MSKVINAGEAITITSSIKLEDLILLSKFQPKALVILDEDKAEVFRVFASKVPGTTGSIAKNGISFHAENTDGYATVSVIVSPVEDMKQFIFENYFSIVQNLSKVEEQAAIAMSNLKAEMDGFKTGIQTI